MIGVVKDGIKRWALERRTRSELSTLSDRELDDIGIRRSDIRWVVADNLRR